MKKILIVDDDHLVLLALSKAFKNESTTITTVDNGQAALSEIAASHYDLCYLDVFLPDMNGLGVLKTIRTVSPETKVVMISAGVMNNDDKKSIEQYAHIFLPKPFDLLHIKMLNQRMLESW